MNAESPPYPFSKLEIRLPSALINYRIIRSFLILQETYAKQLASQHSFSNPHVNRSCETVGTSNQPPSTTQRPRADMDAFVCDRHYAAYPERTFITHPPLSGLPRWCLFWQPPSSEDPGQVTGLPPPVKVCIPRRLMGTMKPLAHINFKGLLGVKVKRVR